MKINRFAALFLIAPVIGGCGFYHWTKPGADDAAFKQDAAQCEAQAPNGFDACMQQQGWTFK
jgi:hypothetical protein